MNCPICQKVVLTHNDYGLCLACADAVINEMDQQAVVRAIKVVRSNICVQADGLDSWGNLGKCTICGKAWQECSCLARR